MQEDVQFRKQRYILNFVLAPLYAVIYIGIFVNSNQRNEDCSNVYQK